MTGFITKSVVLCLLFFLCSCEGMDGLLKNKKQNIIEDIVYSGSYQLTGAESSLVGFNYTHISGNLEIGGTTLQHLNELEVLISIEGDFVVENNPTLNNLNGIDSLEYVGGDIRFTNNPQLNQVNLKNACSRIIDTGGTILGKVYFDGVEIIL